MGNAASSLPYTIGKTPISTNVLSGEGWSLHDGQKKSDNTPVSVFIAKKTLLQKTIIGSSNKTTQQQQQRNPNKYQFTQYACAMNHYIYAKKLRHPHILTVTATLDTDNPNDAVSGTATNTNNQQQQQQSSSSSSSTAGGSIPPPSKDATGDLIIVTEPCIPYTTWLQQTPSPTLDQLIYGLQCMIHAIHFLHTSANVCHGNISFDSFFVTPAGDVKLWNFALVSSFNATTPPSVPRHFMDYENIMTPSIFRSPERIEQRWDVIASSGIHVIDSYSFGILITQLFQQPTSSYPIPNQLVKAVQRLQTTNLKMRPKLQPLLKCPIFDSIYIKILCAIQEFSIMSIEDKIQFWNDTLSIHVLQQQNILPVSVIIQKIIPFMKQEIITICENEVLRTQELYRKEIFVLLGPFFYIVENILVTSTTVDTSSSSTTTTNPLIHYGIGKMIGILYKVNDRAIRGTLLQKAYFMSNALDKNTLNDAVFEPMCGGFSDSSSALRELTLKATAYLVPHLTHPNLEKLSRYLVRLQNDTESSIRTNTVIFFSKLAPYLTEVTRSKILLPAFVRAMKDPFTPCRLAALKSTVQAKTFFDPMGIASRVLPAITPQLLDPSHEVRREAFMAVDDLLFVLRQESERLSTLPEPTMMINNNNNPNIPSNGVGVPSAPNNNNNRTAGLPQQPTYTGSGGGVPAPFIPTPQQQPPPPATTAAATTATTTSTFSLGGISSWMTSSTKSTSTSASTSVTPQPSPQPVPMYPTPAPLTVPVPSLNQMNINGTNYMNNYSNTINNTNTSNNDNWDDIDDDDIDDNNNNDGGGWGDVDDDDLDISQPKSTSVVVPTQNQQQPPTNTTTSSSSLFAANNNTNEDDDDFFGGGFDNKKAKPVLMAAPRTTSTGAVGKLVVPNTKKSTPIIGGKISTTTPKPVIKKLNTDDDVNWDDF